MSFRERLRTAQPLASDETVDWIVSKSVQYVTYLDGDFQTQILRPANFNSRLWELVLCSWMSDAAFELIGKTGSEWPDFSFRTSTGIIHVEAVSPTSGTENNAIQLIPEGEVVQISGEVSDWRLLRLTNVLYEKKRKISGYIERGIIAKDDLTIIAINWSWIDGFFVNNVLGAGGLESVLYWVHELVYTLKMHEDGSKSGAYWYTVRKDIERWERRAPVSANFFGDPNNSSVNWVLYCPNVSCCDCSPELYYCHNGLSAINCLTRDLFQKFPAAYKEFTLISSQWASDAVWQIR